ncbi:glutamate N-acetyltransferase [Tribonema minus]|uniref:Arginine biosynthesis bifunctional protein ArgJ, mitochondrial n=1 Tax=Tribonema minus TaxID=303371 RepID=A0A835Z9Q2_9STRA|nr:glutamate N-acetyltransferase [Tribonema minus]
MTRAGRAALLALAAAYLNPRSHAFVGGASIFDSAVRRSMRTRGGSSMPVTRSEESTEFANKDEYLAFLREQGDLPAGFSVGAAGFSFSPIEVPTKKSIMNVTVIALDEPTENWAAVFTRNLFPGAPVLVGRRRLASGASLQGIVVNNKISNVCPGGEAGAGERDSEAVCGKVAEVWGFAGGADAVLPSSTGVIGWRLPTQAILDNLSLVQGRIQRDSLAPAARSIMTTDRYPKLRGCRVGATGASVVGIAKGAGMIEPNMATMLVYILTDLDVPRSALQSLLRAKVDASFNCISVDSDTSTSDTVVLVSSGKVAAREGDLEAFGAALESVCKGLAQDVVRNGEGTTHVMEVLVKGAPSDATARRVGKEVVNSPLFKCAVAGNDPNVGRLLAVVGRVMGVLDPAADLSRTRLSFGGKVVFENGQFCIDPALEDEIYAQFKSAEILVNGEHVAYPPHMRTVQIEVDMGLGDHEVTVYGSDLTAEYVRINADYRS